MALDLTVRSREALVYEGSATSVTSFNDIGEFDILEGHANFISLIKEFVVINKDMDGEKKFSIEQGVLISSENKVSVYVQD